MPVVRGADTTGPRGRPPLGIAIYCVLGCLGTVLTLFQAAYLVDQGGVLTPLGYIVGAFGILYFLVLVGLWTIRSWAWTAAIVILPLDILVHIVSLNIIPALVLSGLWLYLYLKKPLYRS